MLPAANAMISNTESKQPVNNAWCANNTNYNKLLLNGVVIGMITGLLGAGGGFLFIPALVMLIKLPMSTAIGTLLLIIALNSIAGFVGDLGHYTTDWRFLLTITGCAIAGIVPGGMLARNMPATALKKVFGWFVLAMGFCMILYELLHERTI